MRATGSLLFFRVVAVALMLCGVIAVAAIGMGLNRERPQDWSLLAVGGGWWYAFQFLAPPMLVFTGGAILYVLVEIAVRLGRPSADAFPGYSRQD